MLTDFENSFTVGNSNKLSTKYILRFLSCLFFVFIVYRQKFASGDKVTSFGTEYLCNTCLSREPTPVTELRVSTTTSDDDDDNANKEYLTKYSSVSAPATPAKQDLSATARTVSMTDGDSSLDMSTRSLLDVQAEGMCRTPLYFLSSH